MRGFFNEDKFLNTCDYCGREATHRFKTGKRSYCCENNVSKCPVIRKINSDKTKLRVGWSHSEETKEKIGKSNLGKKCSEETRAKMRKPKSEEHKRKLSEVKKGKPLINKGSFKKGFTPWNKGVKGLQVPWDKGISRSEETKRKISAGHIGKKLSKETREKISQAHIGGKRGDETRRKMSLAATGEKSSQWRGGIASLPYPSIWLDKEFKSSIKERDNYKCQNLDCWGKDKRLTVHHIDYDKDNCNLNNLITLCSSCNTRANVKRDFWQGQYQQAING